LRSWKAEGLLEAKLRRRGGTGRRGGGCGKIKGEGDSLRKQIKLPRWAGKKGTKYAWTQLR